MTRTAPIPVVGNARGARPRAWMLPAPAMFLLAWGGNHFTPLLHVYEELGSYAPWQVNLLLGTYVAGLIPGLLVAAALSDRYGRKRIFVIGTVLAVAGSALIAVGLHQFAVLCLGRVLAGIGAGIAMSVGTSWMKELSSAPFDPHAGISAGARRPSLTLTLGFGLGAAVTGALAQWGPAPTMLPFVLHGALTIAALVLLVPAPESLRSPATGAWYRDLRVPTAGHRHFTRLVLPAAPWVLAACGVAYAVLPAAVQPRLGEWTTIYATSLTVLTLGTGALVQNFVPAIDRRTNGGALMIGLGLMAAGFALAAAAVVSGSPAFATAVAGVLGVAYGICLVAGLLRVQAIATPHDLAGLTGIYYALAYGGFLLPTVLAALLPVVPYQVSLGVVVLLCLVSLAVVARETVSARHGTRR